MPQASAVSPGPQSFARWWLIAAAAACCVVCLIVGPWPVALGGVLLLVCVAKGAIRGVAPVVGVLTGVVVNALASGALGRALAGPVGGLLGLGGLAARIVSICVVGAVLLVGVTWVVTPLVRRWTGRRPNLKRWDGVAGGTLGALEGVGLTLLVCLVVRGVAPIAEMRVRTHGTVTQAPDPVAVRLAGAAKVLRESAVGQAIQSVVPMPDSGMIGLIADFVEVANHPEALQVFLASEPLARLRALPSAQEVLGAMEQDPALREIVRGDRPIDAQGVLAILNSDVVLRALDESTLLADASPLAPEVRASLEEAKRQSRAGGAGPG